MTNILINNKCHGKCEYCFQKGWLNDKNIQDMTPSSFKKAVNFLEKIRSPIINLAGGEPTIHPHFINYLKILCEKRFSIVNILTNGLFIENSWVEWFGNQKKKETGILFNVRSPETYSDKDWTLLNENIRVATDVMAPKIHVGTTLTVNFSQEEEIRNLMLEYGIFDHRISLSAPSFGYDNHFVHKDDLTLTGKMVANIMRRNLDEKIMTHVDCPIPPCAFDEDDFIFVRRWGERLRHRCSAPPLDITPDLHIWYCSSMRDTSMWGWKIEDLENFRNINEIYHQIELRLNQCGIRQLPLLDKCPTCERWYMCQGGCLKLKLENFPVNPPIEKKSRKGLFDRVFGS